MRQLGRYAVALSVTLASLPVAAQQNAGPVKAAGAGSNADPIEAEGYITPPDAVAKLVGAPRMNNFTWGSPSTTRKYLLHVLAEEPTLATLGSNHYNLGGWQIDPGGNRSRAMTTRSATGYELLDWAANKTIKIEAPVGMRASTYTSWSPDGATLGFFGQGTNGTFIFLADPVTGKSRQLIKNSVVATNVTSFEWTADGKSIVAVLVPDARGPEPKQAAIAENVRVRVNENNKLKTRNYADLLENPYDKALFEYYNMGQLALIDLKTGKVTNIGEPGMIRSMDPSPDGKYVRVTYVDKPFSYIQQTSSFGSHEVIIDGSGKVLKKLNEREMSEGVATDIDPADQPQRGGGGGGRGGGGGADSTKRNLTWHPFESGLMFFRSASKDSLTRHKDDSTAAARARANRNANAAGGRAGAGAGAGGGRGAAGNDSTPAASRPDTMFLWQAPFNSSASPEFKPLYVTQGNGTISNVQYSENGRIMFVTETVNGQGHTDAIYLDENNARFTVVSGGGGGGAAQGGRGGGGGGGRGGAPAGGGGPLLTKTGNRGQTVVMMSSDGKYVYTAQAAAGAGRGGRGGRGAGAGADTTGANAPKPFIDRIEVKTGTRSRVYEASVTDKTEAGLTPLNDDVTKGITTRQSRTQPAESFLVDVASKSATQLTHATDYWPQITNAIHKTVMARRSDGLPIRVNLTLPPGYVSGTRMPALFWFYPSEYENQDAYACTLADSLTGRNRDTNPCPAGGGGGGGGGRGGGNANGPGTFTTPGQRTMSFITAAGYILVEPDAPIVATDGKLPNDNYVTDLRNGLSAVINALDTLKYIDRNKLALGGHSYGAFSTMNAMVNTDFFKAGIAGDGMYNRTLTPNGFQNERRDIYQGKDTYLAMSPFLKADQLSGAILMYHSLEDQNVGTDPISSIRMYQALMGQGKTASLYMYPYEDHGPVARETNLDQWARWIAWLDKYVKNPEKKIAQ